MAKGDTFRELAARVGAPDTGVLAASPAPTIVDITWGKPRVLLPVIHTLSENQVRRSLDEAFSNGADGAFLINQNRSYDWIRRVGLEIRAEYPDKWLGVNFLGIPDYNGLPATLTMGFNGYWTDHSGVGEDFDDEYIEEFAEYRQDLGGDLLWFGGVAFKYRTEIPLERIPALIARSGPIDVVTTTGAETGKPPNLDKVTTFRDALGGRPMALASGITPENVREFLPYTQAFLVASGLELAFGYLDGARVRALADLIHG